MSILTRLGLYTLSLLSGTAVGSIVDGQVDFAVTGVTKPLRVIDAEVATDFRDSLNRAASKHGAGCILTIEDVETDTHLLTATVRLYVVEVVKVNRASIGTGVSAREWCLHLQGRLLTLNPGDVSGAQDNWTPILSCTIAPGSHNETELHYLLEFRVTTAVVIA